MRHREDVQKVPFKRVKKFAGRLIERDVIVDPGVINENVQSTESASHPFNGLAAGSLPAKVGIVEDDRVTPAQSGHECVASFAVTINDGDAGAFLNKQLRAGCANSRGAAGYENGFVFQLQVHLRTVPKLASRP
jgi:hypothetical protein